MKNKNTQIHRESHFHWVGNGFPVRSIFNYNDLGQELSPFLLLDYAAPYQFKPAKEKRGVGAHPHRGFETVTIVYQGELEHRDSGGGGGVIGPGDVQWMTAASGLVHDEFHSDNFTQNGGTFEVAQLWVNLPAQHKKAEPGYQTIKSNAIPVVAAENGSSVRVIAGEFNGAKGPAKTFTPIELWDVQIPYGGTFTYELPDGYTKALLIQRGGVSLAGDNAREGDLVVFARESESISFEAVEGTRLLLMSGQPINEPIVGYGPFVMNYEAEIKQAYLDFKQGKLGQLE